MKSFFTYLFLFTSSFLLFNCKKYPEGGCERRGPKNIIGDWKLTLYEVNGIDSTELINYNGNDGYKKVTFLKEQTKHNPHLYAHPEWGQENIISFTHNNEMMEFKTNGSYKGAKICGGIPVFCVKQFFNPEVGSAVEWEIVKLTKKEIIIISSQKKSYKIKLIRK